jgi:hypothetical protein
MTAIQVEASTKRGIMPHVAAIETKRADRNLGLPPRAVRTTKRAHLMRWGLIALALSIPTFFIVHGKNERRRFEGLAADGKQVSGTIVKKASTKSGNTLQYQYQVDGASYGGNVDVDSREFDSKSLDSPVVITYLPADPKVNAYGSVSREDGVSAQRKKTVMGVLGGALVAAGCGRDRTEHPPRQAPVPARYRGRGNGHRSNVGEATADTLRLHDQ